jgi:hypothetical protein
VVDRSTAKVALVVLVAYAFTLAFAGAAFAHNQDSASGSCTEVSGTFSQFAAGDHPIVWHVSVNGGAFQTVPTSESPPGFVGTGTATAGISALTASIGTAAAPDASTPVAGAETPTGTVAFFATWPGGQSATTSMLLSACAQSPPTTTTPPTTAPPTTTSPPPTIPDIPVLVKNTPVVFSPPVTATVAVPVVATPATTG